jgi:serine/threonine-protein kinase
VATPFRERGARFSPDGNWLAYVSDESGRDEVYVQPYPGPGGKRPVSVDGGAEPAWSPNGRELFYRNDDEMLAVPVQFEPSFALGEPRVLFRNEGYILDGVGNANYDVFPDGDRFIMVEALDTIGEQNIVLVLNWFEELKRLVPTN